ncbi:uncharacterized protein LOC126092072 isoform X1 [Schistocerca cancellata]|uniref:uncharacterized protein LOC126092072 isoform X1 n=1 Tax=Schistocerca cancellata TaxID=274614 RepID=UPI002117ED08|nr:uncharacterized protein LOC126092072 isoform X1 [Schistocerca cancellata]
MPLSAWRSIHDMSVEGTLRFIESYHRKNVLWDVNNKYYNNRQVRINALSELGNEFNLSISAVKNKIKSLRSYFAKTHQKVMKKKSSGEEESAWFAYKPLLFILDGVGTKQTSDSDEEDTTVETDIFSDTFEVIDEGEIDHSNADVVNELCTPSVSFVTSVAKPEPRMKKIKLDPIARQKDPLHITHSFSERSSSKSEQEIPTIVKVWCEKLLTLDPQQRIFAEKAINDVLFEASLGTLHRHSVTINSSPLLSSPSASSPRKTFCASCSASLAVGTRESFQEAKDTEKDSTS